MEKKIYRIICAVVITAIFIFGLILTMLCRSFYTDREKQELRNVGRLIIGSELSPEEMSRRLNDVYAFEIGVTAFSRDGTVIYNSDRTYSENADFPEVSDAFETGEGEREYEGGERDIFYFAVLCDDTVIRFSREKDSVYAVYVSLLPAFGVSALFGVISAVIASRRLSAQIMGPINALVQKLDVVKKKGGKIKDVIGLYSDYEELAPLTDAAEEMSKRLEKYIGQLKNEKDRIKLITANMVEGMVLIDKERNILSVNKSAVNMLNPDFPDDSREKRNITELTKSEELIRLLNKSEEMSSVSSSINIGELYLRVFVSRAETDSQRKCGTVIMLVDETEIRRTEEIRRDFSANVSHELKTPLTTIKGFGEMLGNGMYTDEDDVRRYGSRIYSESERLLQLINDIIRLSEIEEQTAVQLERADLMQIAEDTADILMHKAEQLKIQLTVTGKPAFMMINRSYMTELMLNLADNAIKYNNPGGYVNIDISQDNGGTVITVKDNGIGIPEESQARIFERFYRVDKSHSRQTGGTGLGLSIVKHITAYHRGNVKLESRLGEGTCVTVSFPVNSQIK
ncbi:MAG: hypothetical protein IJ446_08595 [Oscillospiraceae bacterium]|nr:hypothetical protein [Oscillospiraceae bacterium]